MSVEHQRRNLVVGASLSCTAAALATGLARVFAALSRALDDFSDGFEYLEQDCARRYRDLTGVDLGRAIGEPQRFDSDARCARVDEEDA